MNKHGLTYKTLKTPTAITGNNGYHFLFKVHASRYEAIEKQKLGLTIDGEHYDIDVKANNGLLYCYPTKYESVNGDIKTYKWIDDTLFKYEISDIPDFLYDIILDNHTNKYKPVTLSIASTSTRVPSSSSSTASSDPEYKPGTPVDIVIENVDIPEEDLELFKMVSFERCDYYHHWLKIGILCYCLYDKQGYKIFDAMSRKSSKYDKYEVRKNGKNYSDFQEKK